MEAVPSRSDAKARDRAEERREKVIEELQEAMAQVKTLKGLIPICANCKKIRDGTGYWERTPPHDLQAASLSFSACSASFQ